MIYQALLLNRAYAFRLTLLSFLTGVSGFLGCNCFLETVILTKFVTLTVIADYSSGGPKTVYSEIQQRFYKGGLECLSGYLMEDKHTKDNYTLLVCVLPK